MPIIVTITIMEGSMLMVFIAKPSTTYMASTRPIWRTR